ncbi:MAG: DUF502 domain-containing protein [Deltaproteobacteria bacterium]|nr:DUF502 domain-containing protein [Deltaproteobacteria bacterium]
MAKNKPRGLHARRYLISGIVTVIPLWVTWLVLEFTFRQLSKFGKPLVWTISTKIQDGAPRFSRLLLQPWFLELVGFLIVIIGLYVLGWMVNRVVGKQVLNFFERLVDRLPVVHTVYGSVKKLISALQTEPDEVERVVLIEFPNENMKTIGLVTRTMTDSDTGQKLAAVYVPTTPNPTSGYLEIVPVNRLVSTDWTIDEAMNFVVSGGAIAPERFAFSRKTESGTGA